MIIERDDSGWHSGASGDDGFLNHVCHSGDGETHTGWGERFEHPTKTWACAAHKQFTRVNFSQNFVLSSIYWPI